MQEKHNTLRLIACAAFALLFLAATVPSVRSYPPFLNKAKSLGLPAKDCTYCHIRPIGGDPLNDRGKWLVAQKEKRNADQVDVSWLKEYEQGAKGSQGQTKGQGRSEATAKPATQSSHTGQQSGNVEQELMRIEREWADSLIRGDVSVTERLAADDYTFTAPDGTTANKAQMIAYFKSGDLKIQTSNIEDMRVRVYGDMAIVTYRTTDKATFKGQDISGQSRWTDVFVKRNGRWQAVAGQGTRIAQPSAKQ